MSKNTYRNTRLRLIQEEYSRLLSADSQFDWQEFPELNFATDYNSELYKKIKGSLRKHSIEINELIQKYSKERDFNSLNPIDVAILRVAIAEAFYLKDVSYKIVFNEAIEIAKSYGTANSYKYINGVLGAILRQEFPELESQINNTNDN